MAESFTSPADVPLADARLALFTGGGSSATVYLASDAGGMPGTTLDTLVQQNPVLPPNGSMVTFDCASCPILLAGDTYWIIATAPTASMGWYWNDTGDNRGMLGNVGTLSPLVPIFGVNGATRPAH